MAGMSYCACEIRFLLFRARTAAMCPGPQRSQCRCRLPTEKYDLFHKGQLGPFVQGVHRMKSNLSAGLLALAAATAVGSALAGGDAASADSPARQWADDPTGVIETVN